MERVACTPRLVALPAVMDKAAVKLWLEGAYGEPPAKLPSSLVAIMLNGFDAGIFLESDMVDGTTSSSHLARSLEFWKRAHTDCCAEAKQAKRITDEMRLEEWIKAIMGCQDGTTSSWDSYMPSKVEKADLDAQSMTSGTVSYTHLTLPTILLV